MPGKKREDTSQPILVSGGRKFKYDKEKTTGGDPNNSNRQWRLPNIRLFGDTQFRAPPNPNRPNRLW
jgi:hypothetical protein